MSRPWMPLYVADYLADTGHLSAAEHGGYLLLIMHYWSNGALPTEDRKLARIARMAPDEWADARETIAEFFDAEWRHERIEKELSDAKAAYERRASAGRKGGNAKAETASRSSNATSLPEHCQSNEGALLKQSQPQSHISSSSLRSEDEPRAKRALPPGVKAELDGFTVEFNTQFWPAWQTRRAQIVAARPA